MTPPAKVGTPEGKALYELILETLGNFFRLRAAGRSWGAVTPWGGGLWGVLRTLKMSGPCTVPQIARMRPVARQRIQRLANEMVASGLAEFVNNPAHKRSKLLCLTPTGEAKYQELMDHMQSWTAEMAQGMALTELETATRIMRDLRRKLGEYLASK